MTAPVWPLVNPDGDGWRRSAACRDLDPGLFFPAAGEGREREWAQAVCDTCPVRSECMAFAVATNQKFGIWGGVERDRRGRPRSRRHRQEGRRSAD